MKNRKMSVVTLLFTIVTLFFVACSNNLINGTVNGPEAKRSVSITISNFANTNSSARTIAPDAISKDDAANYIFIVEGSNSRTTFGPVICELSDGRIDLSNLDASGWTITITAYEKALLEAAGVAQDDADAIKAVEDSCAVLSGVAYADLTNADATTSATLTPDGVGINGNVNLSLTFNAADISKISNNSLTVTAGLYNKITGEEINSSAISDTTAAQYTANDVAKGLYIFKITIESTDGTGPWYYTDDIYIEGNRTTEQTITLPKIIGEAPTAPSDLSVTYDEENAEFSRYTANFSWIKNSYNESGFELQIVEVDEIPTAIDESLFADETTGLFDIENFASTEYPIYAKDGTLLAGSQNIDYYLEAGKVYIARVRAVNYNGKSDWAYLDSIINQYTVTYDFAGYKLVKEAETITPSVVKFVEFDSATPYVSEYTDYKLYKAAADIAVDSELNWAGWKNRADNSSVDSYDGFKNIVLTPNIETYLDFEIESAGTYKDLLNGKLFAGTTENPTEVASEIVYDETTAPTMYVAIADVSDDATVTNVKYTLKGVDGSVFYATGDNTTNNFVATFALVDILSGDYTLYAEATITAGYVVTTQIQLIIK